jgi:UDP-2,3-diacylglucosamine pyrophosphatase LpxH
LTRPAQATVVVSDLHAGCPYFRQDLFLRWLAALPPETTLVLNGDTVDRVRPCLAEHQPTLDRLAEESRRRRVVWVRGNHDPTYRPREAGRIEFARSFEIPGTLYAAHGHGFDNLKTRLLPVVLAFRLLYLLRIWLGAPPTHVALYAKRWRLLYAAFRRHVALNAVQHARENGFAAVTCGHVHFAEDTVLEGVRYINTGSWTEEPARFLRVEENARIELATQP